ncbi:MAG: ribonuclease Z [Bacteroidetes bacterium]|nr:ribonuclease Z [Bacteroidota bacterium]
MIFEVTILGSNGAVPAYDRHPSAQIVNHNGNIFLVDCGETTQFQMNRYGIKRGKLDHIFISHLHGDHYFGLIGLITSFSLHWRENPLHIYAPAGLEDIINVQLKYSNTELRFDIYFHALNADAPRIIYEDEQLTVETIILKHRLPTTGFLFKEKKHLRHIIPEKIAQHDVPHHQISDIKKGADYQHPDGRTIPNVELTREPSPARSYAYCSDTAYTTTIAEQLQGVNLLYHEATFMEGDATRAEETFHSTCKQAAQMARLANAGRLLIGHFSARYSDLSVLLEESRSVFPNTFLAEEGKIFNVGS